MLLIIQLERVKVTLIVIKKEFLIIFFILIERKQKLRLNALKYKTLNVKILSLNRKKKTKN